MQKYSPAKGGTHLPPHTNLKACFGGAEEAARESDRFDNTDRGNSQCDSMRAGKPVL